jgi:aldehyde:ferredoxin oxidoreductase
VTWEPVVDDENPPRFYEPLPSGPWKGRTTDRELVDRKRAAYFETLGWDERGIPTEETLERLDLGGLESEMSRLRK